MQFVQIIKDVSQKLKTLDEVLQEVRATSEATKKRELETAESFNFFKREIAGMIARKSEELETKIKNAISETHSEEKRIKREWNQAIKDARSRLSEELDRRDNETMMNVINKQNEIANRLDAAIMVAEAKAKVDIDNALKEIKTKVKTLKESVQAQASNTEEELGKFEARISEYTKRETQSAVTAIEIAKQRRKKKRGKL